MNGVTAFRFRAISRSVPSRILDAPKTCARPSSRGSSHTYKSASNYKIKYLRKTQDQHCSDIILISKCFPIIHRFSKCPEGKIRMIQSMSRHGPGIICSLIPFHMEPRHGKQRMFQRIRLLCSTNQIISPWILADSVFARKDSAGDFVVEIPHEQFVVREHVQIICIGGDQRV